MKYKRQAVRANANPFVSMLSSENNVEFLREVMANSNISYVTTSNKKIKRTQKQIFQAALKRLKEIEK